MEALPHCTGAALEHTVKLLVVVVEGEQVL